jgi:hypothetical protein
MCNFKVYFRGFSIFFLYIKNMMDNIKQRGVDSLYLYIILCARCIVTFHCNLSSSETFTYVIYFMDINFEKAERYLADI